MTFAELRRERDAALAAAARDQADLAAARRLHREASRRAWEAEEWAGELQRQLVELREAQVHAQAQLCDLRDSNEHLRAQLQRTHGDLTDEIDRLRLIVAAVREAVG